jgi:GAF domain-containing protein
MMSRLEQIKQKISDHPSFQKACETLAHELHSNFKHYNWVGIYQVNKNVLNLLAWKGAAPTEHVTIPIGTGICGSAAAERKTILVEDVNKDPRYLQCFLSTRSEIVIPIISSEKVIGEIDIDSDKTAAFNDLDKIYLEDLALELSKIWEKEQALEKI